MNDTISIPDSHPYAAALAAARAELDAGIAAEQESNDGRARVCGRRAVGAFLQAIAPSIGAEPGAHAMANLRWLAGNPDLPAAVRDAAERLLGGARSIAGGGIHSANPVGDAALIINFFVGAALPPIV